VPDKCADEWANLTIIGRCFGLVTHSEYPEFKAVAKVASSEQCRSMCCELGAARCVTWQYWVGISLCKLGKAVRIGSEGANTPLWCDSELPTRWSGRRVSRVSSGGDGASGASGASGAGGVGRQHGVTVGEELTTQCFGLGAERMKPADKDDKVKQQKLTVAECKAECMAQPDCTIWQAHAKRGCYYSNVKDAYCEPYTGAYTGGRRICNDKC
jgi:hypothetical protein